MNKGNLKKRMNMIRARLMYETNIIFWLLGMQTSARSCVSIISVIILVSE